MNISRRTISISPIAVETGLWHIQRHLIFKYGSAIAERDMYPLQWYISTGRASADFISRCLNAKPFMVARKLHQGGSDDEVISRVKSYIGMEG